MEQKVTAESFRQRAAQVREVANSIEDGSARANLENVAADCDRLAAEIETRRTNNAAATPEEAALRVLVIFVETFRRKPGEAVRLQHLQSPFLADGRTRSEFYDGLLYAGSKGWLEIKDDCCVLSEAGVKIV